MKKFIILLAVAVLGLLAAGCATTATYLPPDSVTRFDDSYSDTDLRMMAEQMTRSLIQTPKIVNAGTPPIIAILDLVNKSDQHIPTDIVTDKLMAAMLKTGRLRFVDRKLVRAAAQEVSLGQTGIVDPTKAKRLGKMLAADMLMSGEIESINKRDARTSMTYYRLSLHLTDLETNEVLWADETEIKKQSKKGFEDW